jgi:hypothetical protein
MRFVVLGMPKTGKKQQYYDVEITFADGTSEILNSVRLEDLDHGMQLHSDDIIFVSKDGSWTRIPHDKTILIIDFFALDGRGKRERTRPTIRYCNFNYNPLMEEK